MISRIFRFHGYGALKFVYSRGKMVRSKSLSLKFMPNPRRKESRLSVVVSKKVTKKAPVRNRIRRRIYEIMRQNWPMLSSPHDMVITVFDEQVATMDHRRLQKLVKSLLEQAGLLE